ncbi:MAG TPA: DUF3341 domain-containing protein [Anaerolineae bacterium]|nr:DUF3341 domain-containing protein [Anaerolineae bacterium]
MSELYGLMAKFDTPEEVVEATRKARAAGYRKMEAYSPFPIEELAEILNFKPIIQYIVFIGGVLGAITGFGIQYYASVIAYPLIIGGRPFNSWPAFIVVIFELTVLFAGLAAVFGMLGLNGFPHPYHPVFNAKDFTQVSRDKFFLVIEAADPRFDPERTRAFLESLHPEEVTEVQP